MDNKEDTKSVSAQSLSFWNQLSEDEKETVEKSMVSRIFSKGELISGCSDSCMGMMLVQQGRVRISILSEDGRQITLYHVEEGEVCFSTASCVIAQLTFETMVEAEQESKILILPTPVLEALTERNIYMKAFMYERLTERFSSVVWVMEQIIFKRFDQRLAEFLMDSYRRTGKTELVMTQEEIAVEVNTAREVVARMLKQFAAEGKVELKRGKILLKDLEALEKL